MNQFCSFANGEWDFLDHIDRYAPVLLCDTHGQQAAGSVYDCDPGQEVGLCQPTEEYVEDHTGFYGEGLIGKDVTVDQSRCRCGRPTEVCLGRKDATAIRAHLATLAPNAEAALT